MEEFDRIENPEEEPADFVAENPERLPPADYKTLKKLKDTIIKNLEVAQENVAKMGVLYQESNHPVQNASCMTFYETIEIMKEAVQNFYVEYM